MKVRLKIEVLLVVIAIASFSVIGFAQQPGQERDRSKTEANTLTGCLTKGEAADEYVLTDQKTGSKTMVTGAADIGLAKHVNHTVTLTGTVSSDGTSFAVTKIKHIAASCKSS